MYGSRSSILRLVGIGVVLLAVFPPRSATAVTFADESMVHMVDNCTDTYTCQYSFLPDDITLPAGSGITFMNLSSAPHTATSDTGAFDTGTLPAGGIKRIVFDTPGTYLYHCTIHPTMHGRIVITGTGPTPTLTAVPSPTSTAVPASPTATSVATSTGAPASP